MAAVKQAKTRRRIKILLIVTTISKIFFFEVEKVLLYDTPSLFWHDEGTVSAENSAGVLGQYYTIKPASNLAKTVPFGCSTFFLCQTFLVTSVVND